jgi:hypothetical protein
MNILPFQQFKPVVGQNANYADGGTSRLFQGWINVCERKHSFSQLSMYILNIRSGFCTVEYFQLDFKYDVMTLWSQVWRYDLKYDVMTLWSQVWRYDLKYDVMISSMTLWHYDLKYDVMISISMTLWHYDLKYDVMTLWSQVWRYDFKYDVMISSMTLWSQVWRCDLKYDVMTLWFQVWRNITNILAGRWVRDWTLRGWLEVSRTHRAKRGEFGDKLPAKRGACNPGLTEPGSMFGFYHMPFR